MKFAAGAAASFCFFALAACQENKPTKTDPVLQVTDAAAQEKLVADQTKSVKNDYIENFLRLYDVKSKYYSSYEGRIPGVRFKIKNTGKRTISKLVVHVAFLDMNGNEIAEESYTPILVISDETLSRYAPNDNKPLRPNYIWQQESDMFWNAKNVPSEWAVGKVKAKITEVEFSKK